MYNCNKGSLFFIYITRRDNNDANRLKLQAGFPANEEKETWQLIAYIKLFRLSWIDPGGGACGELYLQRPFHSDDERPRGRNLTTGACGHDSGLMRDGASQRPAHPWNNTLLLPPPTSKGPALAWCMLVAVVLFKPAVHQRALSLPDMKAASCQTRVKMKGQSWRSNQALGTHIYTAVTATGPAWRS